MAAVDKVETLSHQVSVQIRSDIISGRYEPGSPLRLANLAKEFGVSMSVIREVLIRLSEQNLVSTFPNQGFKVVSISREDLEDIVDMRVHLECLAVRRSVEIGDVDWEAKIVSTHHLLERAQFLDDLNTTLLSDEWVHAHAQFHDALGVACGSPRLLAMTRSLRDGSEIYRQLTGGQSLEGKRDVAAEHRELMQLALARDAEGLSSALERHIRLTAEAILRNHLLD